MNLVELLGSHVGGAVEAAVLKQVHHLIEHGLVVKRVPHLVSLRKTYVRLRAARHEERAAVGRLLVGDLKRAEALGLRHNLALVAADKRAEHGDGGHRP